MAPHVYSRQRNRRLSACNRHPAEPVTGFCASCLRERLAGIRPSGDMNPSSSTSNGHEGVDGVQGPNLGICNRKGSDLSSCTLPGFRHTRSASAGKFDGFSGVPEPRRRSCEVKARNTLANLFDIDDESKKFSEVSKVESKNLGISRLAGLEGPNEELENGEKFGFFEDAFRSNAVFQDNAGEDAEEFRPMKEFIDLELQRKKHNARDLKNIAGSVLEAASVFSKKLRNWALNQKSRGYRRESNETERDRRGGDLSAKAVGKTSRQPFRDTQSEIGDYGFGRRSCDTEPRFSVDAGRNRISVDDPRISFDEPRASWDGYLIARTIPRLTPMLSVIEDGGLTSINALKGNQTSKEEQMNSIDEYEMSSSGSTRMNTDSSSSQRRSSFERSTSIKDYSKRTLDGDEVKSQSLTSKVSPANGDLLQGTRMLITEKELKDWHLKSGKNDCPVNHESSSKNEFEKFNKSHKVLGLVRERNGRKCEITENASDDPVAGLVGIESCRKLIRTTSCASRNPTKMIESYHATSGFADAWNCNTSKGREENAMQRNWSVRCSSNNVENGMLRFYLTPLRSYRRSASARSRLKGLHAFSGNVLSHK